MKLTKHIGPEAELQNLEQRAMARLRKTRHRMKVSGKSVFALKVALTKESK